VEKFLGHAWSKPVPSATAGMNSTLMPKAGKTAVTYVEDMWYSNNDMEICRLQPLFYIYTTFSCGNSGSPVEKAQCGTESIYCVIVPYGGAYSGEGAGNTCSYSVYEGENGDGKAKALIRTPGPGLTAEAYP
jgi:hypothetical protein